MTRWTAIFSGKGLIILLIFSGAAVPWIFKERRIEISRLALAQAQIRLTEAVTRSDAAATALESARVELSDERDKRLTALVQVKTAEEEAAKPVKDDPWSDLPSDGPQWLANSPYIWVNKKVLSAMRGHPFTSAGELRKDYAEALAISEAQRKAVSKAIAATASEFRSLEIANAERTVAPPAKQGDSPTITVRIPAMPEQSPRLMSQLEAALEAELGAGRKDLLLSIGNGDLYSEIQQLGKEGRRISALRHANGTYEIKSGNGMVSGSFPLSSQIPVHLMPLFQELEDQTH